MNARIRNAKVIAFLTPLVLVGAILSSGCERLYEVEISNLSDSDVRVLVDVGEQSPLDVIMPPGERGDVGRLNKEIDGVRIIVDSLNPERRRVIHLEFPKGLSQDIILEVTSGGDE